MLKKLIIMGVAGSGKSSVGEALHERFGWTYIDGDHLHPEANIAKMEQGTPLTDEDRAPWLRLVGEELRKHRGTVVVGCSALKRRYRDIIREAADADVCFIHLEGSRDLIEGRMRARTGHFMPVSLLDSQFADLEPPKNELAITVDINAEPPSIVDQVAAELKKLEA
ncbi:MAG: gluconokinase [Pseudomonadota bacterium]